MNDNLTEILVPAQSVSRTILEDLEKMGIKFIDVGTTQPSKIFPLRHWITGITKHGPELYHTGVYFVIYDPYDKIAEVTDELFVSKDLVYIGETATFYRADKTKHGVGERLGMFARDIQDETGTKANHNGSMRKMITDYDIDNYKTFYIPHPEVVKFNKPYSVIKETQYLTEYLQHNGILPLCNKAKL